MKVKTTGNLYYTFLTTKFPMTIIIKIVRTEKLNGASNDPVRKYPAKQEHSNRTTKIPFSPSAEGKGNAISFYKSSTVINMGCFFFKCNF